MNKDLIPREVEAEWNHDLHFYNLSKIFSQRPKASATTKRPDVNEYFNQINKNHQKC